MLDSTGVPILPKRAALAPSCHDFLQPWRWRRWLSVGIWRGVPFFLHPKSFYAMISRNPWESATKALAVQHSIHPEQNPTFVTNYATPTSIVSSRPCETSTVNATLCLSRCRREHLVRALISTDAFVPSVFLDRRPPTSGDGPADRLFLGFPQASRLSDREADF